MDENARRRLKAAIAESGKTAKAISLQHGWPETYVSRVTSGNIVKPDPSRLLAICTTIEADMAYILTGETIAVDRKQLIEELASAPNHVLEQVAEFVRNNGLKKSN